MPVYYYYKLDWIEIYLGLYQAKPGVAEHREYGLLTKYLMRVSSGNIEMNV